MPADPPQAVSGAEAERRRLAVNADRSAYQQPGLRPAGGEPWRPFAGGGMRISFGVAKPESASGEPAPSLASIARGRRWLDDGDSRPPNVTEIAVAEVDA
jgi:hypothetical protein